MTEHSSSHGSNHSEGTGVPPTVPPTDLERLLAGLTGPIATLAGVVVETIGGAVQTLLDRSYQAGREAGRADVEHRVARSVGTPGTDGGVWARCRTCGGDGLVEDRAEHPPRSLPVDLRDTAVIPRITDGGDTAILPRLTGGGTHDQRRRG